MKFLSFLILLLVVSVAAIIFAPQWSDKIASSLGVSPVATSIRSTIHTSTSLSQPSGEGESFSSKTHTYSQDRTESSSGIITQVQSVLTDAKGTLDGWISVAREKTGQAKELKGSVEQLAESADKVEQNYQKLKTFSGTTE